jgi:hypothetical protein
MAVFLRKFRESSLASCLATLSVMAVSVSLDIDDGGTTADVIKLPVKK